MRPDGDGDAVTVKSKRVEQGEATSEALLTAAQRLFGEYGYAGTSLQAIVRTAGVTKGAFYHHFGGKDEIFLRVYERVKRNLGQAAFIVHTSHDAFSGSQARMLGQKGIKLLHQQTDEEVWQELIARCRLFIELQTDPRVQRIALLDPRSVLSWDQWHRVEQEHGTLLLRADLRRAMNRGLIRRLPLALLATMLSGALHEACMEVAHAEDAPRALDDAGRIVRHFLEGLRVDAHDASMGASAQG